MYVYVYIEKPLSLSLPSLYTNNFFLFLNLNTLFSRSTFAIKAHEFYRWLLSIYYISIHSYNGTKTRFKKDFILGNIC